MGEKPPIELSVDQKQIQAIAKALKSEEDGKQLRKDLIADLKVAVAPGVSAVKSKLQAMPGDTAHASPAVGSYLASKVVAQARVSGRNTGVAVRIKKTPQLRGFINAARRFNQESWRHKVFGRDVWVEQTSPIQGFFDDTLKERKDVYRVAILAAVKSMADRVAARAK